MKKHLKSIALAAAAGTLALAGTAMAAKVGDTLYVKAKNTKVLKAAGSADAVKVLQPGATVIWKGADADKKWQKVTADGVDGVVFVSNLSNTKPSTEIVAGQGGKQMDAQAFASSGAASKALGEGAKEYAKEKDLQKAASDLQFAEGLSKKVTNADVNAHAKKAGIYPVVGEKS